MIESRESYQVAMREAHSLAWDLKWEAASQKYREALALVPDDPTARLSLAVALGKLGNNADALKEYLVVRRLLPSDTLVLARVADLYQKLGHAEEAVRSTLDLASLYREQGPAAKAVAALRRAVEYAGRERRSLLLVKEAVAQAGDAAVLAEVEAALAHARPDSEESAAIVAGESTPSPDAAGAATEERPTYPSPIVIQAAPQPESPKQLLVAAEREAQRGEVGLAVADYLRAAETATDPEPVDEARRAAEELTAGWLIGGLDELTALPPVYRSVLLDAMHRSHAALMEGQHASALDEAMRAIGAEPAYLPAQLRLAEVYWALGRQEEARERASSVAELYRLRGQHVHAVAALRQQVTLEPERDDVWRQLVDCLLGAGLAERAAEDLFAWSEVRLAAGEVAEALERQAEALRMVDRADLWLRHGLLLERLGRTEDAFVALGTAREFAPNDVAIAAAESRCQALLGAWPSMEANLEFVGEALPASADAATVVQAFRSALERDPESVGLQYCLGVALRAVGKAAEAATYFERAAFSDGRPGRLARYHLGAWQLEVGKASRAVEALRGVGDPAVLEDGRERALAVLAYEALASALVRLGDWSGLAQVLRSLVAAKPENETLLTRLAEAYFRLGTVPAALDTLYRLAVLQHERSKSDQAAAVCRGMIQLDPQDLRPRELLARIALETGQREQGLAELEKMASLLLERGEIDRAVAVLRTMLDACRHVDQPRALAIRERLASLRPEDVDTRLELAEAYLKAGRSVRAEAEVRALVDALIDEGRLADAARALQFSTQLDPWNLAEKVRLGGILGQLGRTDEAMAVLKAVLAREPENRAAADGLASLLAQLVSQE